MDNGFGSLSPLSCEGRVVSTKSDGRLKIDLAANVEAALQSIDTHGRRYAARLMTTDGVPFSVIVRVLAEPDKRRQFDEVPKDTACQKLSSTAVSEQTRCSSTKQKLDF